VGTDFSTNGTLGIMNASQVEGFVRANAGATLFTTHPPVGVTNTSIINDRLTKFQVRGATLYVTSITGGQIKLSIYNLSGKCIISNKNILVASGVSGVNMGIIKAGSYIYKVTLNRSESDFGRFIVE
jgi:hypothetical protein